jgi:molybdopterin/thiamine biosynthesis adenylyltransferase
MSQPFDSDAVERYARQLVLREIGGPGQQKLRDARVLIVGAGGLGSPAALYLVAAGVGTLGLCDPDSVALSNLQRQILFGAADLGGLKVDVARERLSAINPLVQIDGHALAVTDRNAGDAIAGYDIVLDGTDDFTTRFAVNRACVAADIPLVSGAISRWTGQIGVFRRRPCYRCLVPEVPPDAETCARVGVVGALGGVIGSMMALEAIKVIVEAGEGLGGRLLIYDALAAEARTVRLNADPECPVCGQREP